MPARTPRPTKAQAANDAAVSVGSGVDGKVTSSGLTYQQEVFVEAYLRTWDAAKAAREAGYSEKTARAIGSENLTKPNIKAHITKRLDELKQDTYIVVRQLTDIARGDMADFLNVSPDGEVGELNLNKSPEKLHLIKKLKFKRMTTKDDTVIDETTVELYSRLDALDTLAKIHGLLAPTELNVTSTLSLTDLLGGDVE